MSTHMGRRPLKVRRTGRHTAPSQVGTIAAQAGRAAPAVAIAGALVAAASQPQAAVKSAAKAPTPAERMHTASKVNRTAQARTAAKVARAARAGRTYTVRPGDTLTGIAQRLYGHPGYVTWLYMANRTQLSDPNRIYPGQVLRVPAGSPQHAAASYAAAAHLTASHAPRTERAAQPESENDGQQPESENDAQQPQSAAQPESENDGGSQDGSSQAATTSSSSDGSSSDGASSSGASSSGASSPGSTTLSGTLGCSGLEQLWQQAGGSPAQAVTAASVAMAESSGQQDASSPAGDVGYWQINEPIWGPSLATSDPLGNAKAAVDISHNGADWTPWVTYTSGAYAGQCSGAPAPAPAQAAASAGTATQSVPAADSQGSEDAETTGPGTSEHQSGADGSGGHEDSAGVTFDYSAHR